MTKRSPIIALAPNPWFGPWKNRQQLMSRLAERGWPIVYSTGPLSVWDRHRDKWSRSKVSGSFASDSGLVVDLRRKWPLRWPTWRLWDQLALRLAANRLRRAAPDGSGLIAYLFHPSFFPLVEFLRPDYVVYHAFDLFSAAVANSWITEHQETALIDRADLVIASTKLIAARLPGEGPRRAQELLNAADSKAFARGATEPCPDDLAPIPEPRIGYIGNINMKVDFDIISMVAEARPDANWVLIGPVYFDSVEGRSEGNEMVSAWRRCIDQPNVYWLGEKKHTELPAYVAHMTVNTMCYKLAEGWWTVAYPLKVHEYLASGKPVVSVAMEACRGLSDVVDFADTKEEWLTKIDQAIGGGGVGTPAERRAIALENTWDHRVDQLESMLFDMIGQGTSEPG